ncbi:MAG TPA: UbiH/UbiF/VisC/COQ6 family ubiquinone biosynthesis hydroxylase [Aliidongia sp.]|nr:UbiH/UbiF/VisC/COQ6 family ubiquinone biosynthesis hydroxylase [Aliidongia sp.]
MTEFPHLASTPLGVGIAVIGGGLAGLPLAIACAGAGIRTAVVDREPPSAMLAEPFDGRSSAIAFGSQRVLAGLGIWQHVEAAQPILDIRVVDQGSPLFLHYDHREVGEAPFGWIVENRLLRRALFARLAELPDLVHLAPQSVESVERNADGAVIRLGDGGTIRSRLVVAADGRNSALRKAAGIRTLGAGYAQHAITCTVAHDKPHHGVAVEHFLPAGPFAILPMTGDRSSIVWTERARLAPAMMRLDKPDFDRELARRFGNFLGTVESVGPRWSYPLEIRYAERMIDRRLALVGDAAHVIHPIAGQGLNLGIRDVAALAQLVVDACRLGLDPGMPDLLARYQRWRRVDTIALSAVTDGLNRLFSNDLAPVRLVRDVGLALVGKAPPLKRLFIRHAMGMVGTLPRLVRGEAL